ncbi:MAG: N-acetylmuramoyl-L-alanine amidase [Verrucomicrobia bacterium]|nr:N-acetylmuramoyl-L-alanine amidase [Verrucomicrobiota bacterium]
MNPALKSFYALAVFSLLAFAGSGAARKLERVTLFGKEYVRLADWAGATGFSLKWTRKDEQVRLESGPARLVFEADSRKAEVNGINVWLSIPVARKNGDAYLAPLDLDTAIYPVLYPSKNSKGAKIKTICLDPGHGGRDPGNQEGARQEKKFTLALAEELGQQLRKEGFKVVFTRSTDKSVDLNLRPLMANELKADLFISLHFNAAEGTGARGVETYCLTPAHASSTNARGEGTENGALIGNRNNDKNMTLAYLVQRSLVKNLDAEDRGVRRARFAVLKTPEMPAILIEGGFMTDTAESKKIYDTAYRRKIARSILLGIQAYKQTVER